MKGYRQKFRHEAASLVLGKVISVQLINYQKDAGIECQRGRLF